MAKTVDGVTTEYVLDPAAGLTQVLQETTAGQTQSYLYGHDRLAQYDSGTWAYHVNDGLGSVRQLVDPTGQVVQGYSFSPFGVPLDESGGEPYGFAGEQWDASAGLVFLRARYMQPTLGVFLSRDPWMGYEQIPGTYNGFNYAMGNPVNLSDPSGLHPWPGIELMARFFDLHSLRHGAAPFGPHDPRATTTAKEAVELCRASYNKENWNKGVYGFELGQDLPKTAHELFGWYVHEWRGKYKSDRLLFDANEPLTRELAQTCLVNDLRQRYHRGEDLRGPTHEKFKYLQFIETGLLDISSFGSVPVSFFMGSFWYQVKAVDGDVGFRIDNDVTLESGSHIAGRFREDKFIDKSRT